MQFFRKKAKKGQKGTIFENLGKCTKFKNILKKGR